MTTTVHFIDVGQGHMSLVECTNGANFVVDCNITEDNRERVIQYLTDRIGKGSNLDAFICTHRDADHMRGARILHDTFPLKEIRDSDYPGTSTDTPEYRAYMQLRRDVGARVIEKNKWQDFGRTRFRYLSAKDSRLPKEANEQGIVLKVEQRTADLSTVQSSTMLTGDGGASKWKYGIMEDYSTSDVSCSIFLAAHHGSITFFDDPADEKHYYTSHIAAMKPEMVVVSVGNNPHGHPDSKALELYRKYATGSSTGRKIRRTDQQHTMKLTLKSSGGWNLSPDQ